MGGADPGFPARDKTSPFSSRAAAGKDCLSGAPLPAAPAIREGGRAVLSANPKSMETTCSTPAPTQRPGRILHGDLPAHPPGAARALLIDDIYFCRSCCLIRKCYPQVVDAQDQVELEATMVFSVTAISQPT
jgi:hypothetical protein